MSLIDENNELLVEIELYYKFKKIENGKKLIIIEDKKAKKLIEEGNKGIEKITTKWRILNWQEHNEVSNRATQVIDQTTGQRQFSIILYRDTVIKKCLKEWDLTINEKKAPVTPELIDRLPGPVIMELYNKFEGVMDYTEEEVKN